MPLQKSSIEALGDVHDKIYHRLGNIVLWQDFLHAFNNAAQNQPRLTEIFGQDASCIADKLERIVADDALRSEDQTVFPVRYDQLEDGPTKTLIENNFTYTEDDKTYSVHTDQEILALAEMIANAQDSSETAEDVIVRLQASRRQTIIEKMGEQESPNPVLNGFFLNDIMLAMSECRGFPGFFNGINRYNLTSLLHKEGQLAVQFWESVANLPNYRRKFPDVSAPKAPPPRGGIGFKFPDLGIGGVLKPQGA